MDEPITRNEQYLQGAVNAASGQATGDLPEPITREEKYLKGLVDALENGGGSSLPEVTSEDNGKVLKVEDGEWGKGDVGLIVNLTDNNDTTYSGDTTLDTIKATLESGGVVYLSYPTTGNADVRAIVKYTDDTTDGFICGVFSDDLYTAYSVADDGNNGVTLSVESEKGIGAKIVSANTAIVSSIQQAFSTFLISALQNPGEFTFSSTLASIDLAQDFEQINEIVNLMKKGYTLYFDDLTFKFLPTFYAETTGIRGISFHYPLGTLSLPGMGTYHGWCDIRITTGRNITIGGCIIPVT